MINVLICGINSTIGHNVYNLSQKSGLNVVCGVDTTLNGECNCPVYKNFDEVREMVDVVIDFSTPEMLDDVINFCVENKCPLVEGTTGYSVKQKEKLHDASKGVAVFMSYNLSLGVNLLFKLCVETAKALGEYDIEIVEKHNNEKINAPGATTLQIANIINEVLGKKRKIICGRTSKRKHDEICIHALRGGSIVGEHEIMFIGDKEIISLKHVTEDKELYADGAIKIALFMHKKPNGFYTMKEFFNE